MSRTFGVSAASEYQHFQSQNPGLVQPISLALFLVEQRLLEFGILNLFT